MNNLKRIFSGVSTQYLVRAYILGAVFFALIATIVMNGKNGAALGATTLLYFTLCTLLFPFSKLVWDEIKTLVLGQTMLFLPVIFLYPAKFVVNFVLWAISLFIAPFGIAYIWLRTRTE